MSKTTDNPPEASQGRGFWRAFLDWFILFSGISTARNLSRTRKAPVVGRGLFLFRKDARNSRIRR